MESLNLISKMVDNVSQNPSMDESSSSISAESSTTTEADSPTSEEGEIGRLDVSLLSNILECQLEEGPPNSKWSETLHSWEQRNTSERDKEEFIECYPFPTSPRRIHRMGDGDTPAVPEVLLSRIKISPLFTFTKSRSLRLMSKNVIPETESQLPGVFFAKLKQQKFLENPIQWLVCKKILSPPASCRRHKGKLVFNGFQIIWQCAKCVTDSEKVIKLPSLFNTLRKFKVSDILAVILHWACQSDLDIIKSDTYLSADDIWEIWTKLQSLCSHSLKFHGFPLNSRKFWSSGSGYDRCIIEGAAVQYGQFIIFAAFNRTSQFTHLQVIHVTDFCTNKMKIALEKIVKINTTSFYFVSDFVLFQPIMERIETGSFFLPDPSISDPRSKGYHNLNVLKYVKQFLSVNFCTISSLTLDCSILQGYLDELQWRQQFGHHLSQAFWNILYVIGGQNIGRPAPIQIAQEGEPYLGHMSHSGALPWWDVYEPELPMSMNNSMTNNSRADDNADKEVCEILDTPESKLEKLLDNVIVSEEQLFTINFREDRVSPMLELILKGQQTPNIIEYQNNTTIVPTLTVVGKEAMASQQKYAFKTFFNTSCDSNAVTQTLQANQLSTETVGANSDITIVPEVLRSILMAKLNASNVVQDGSLVVSQVNNQDPIVRGDKPSISVENMHDMNQNNGSQVYVENSYRWNEKDMLRNVIVVPEGDTLLTINNLLLLQTWPFVLNLRGTQSYLNLEKEVKIFRKRLVSADYFTKPIQWMTDHHLVHEHSSCDICGCTEFYLTTNTPVERADSYCWICKNSACATRKPFRRLKFFTLFGFSICDILHLIYYWVTQTSLGEIRSKILLNEYKIRYVYWAIQKLISKNLSNLDRMLGGKGSPVEVGIVKYGIYCILGATEKECQWTRMEVFLAPPVIDLPFIEKIILGWLLPQSAIVTNSKFYSVEYNRLNFVYDRHMNEDLQVSIYLQKVVKKLFAKFSTTSLKSEVIQAYLDELQWRERFGLYPEPAFWNIFHQIGRDDSIDITGRMKETEVNNDLPKITSVHNFAQEAGLSALHASPVSNSDNSNSESNIISSEESTLPLVISNLVSLCPDLCLQNQQESEKEERIQMVNGFGDADKPPVIVTKAVRDDGLPIIASSSSSSSFDLMEDNVELVCEEEPPVEPLKNQPFPGVTMLCEEDLIADLDSDSVQSIEEEDEEKEESPDELDQVKPSSDDNHIWDTQMMTIGWKTTKLLLPVIKDYRSKSPGEHVLAQKKQTVTYCLDEYYFSRKKPIGESLPERSYVFCCTFCKLYLHNNIDVMRHSLTHSSEKSLKDHKRNWKPEHCPYCFMQSYSKREIDTHVNEVHESGSSLTCLICSMLFPSSTLLNGHMRTNHSPSEMPFSCSVCQYRSSLHFEVLDHFKEVHRDEPHLMCPFCLKICSPRAKTDAILFTQTYCQHLIKHQSCKNCSKCPSCSLTFLTPAEVTNHILKDHLSFQKQEGVVPFKPRLFPVTLVTFDEVVKPTAKTETIKEISLPTLNSKIVKPAAEGSAIKSVGQSNELLLKQASKTATAKQTVTIPCPSVVPLPSTQPLLTSDAAVIPQKSHTPLSIPSTSQSVHSSPHSNDGRLFLKLKRPAGTPIEQHARPAKRFKPGEDSTPLIKYKISKEFPCVECGSRIKKNHYYKLLVCNCTYSTHCAKSFVYHTVWEHGILGKKKKKKKRRRSLQTLLTRSVSCTCGFAAVDGDVLALHLRHCNGVIEVSPTENLVCRSTKPVRCSTSTKIDPPQAPVATMVVETPPQNTLPLPSNQILPQAQYQFSNSSPIQKESELQMRAMLQQQQQLDYERQWVGQQQQQQQQQMTNVPVMHPNYVVTNSSPYQPHPYPTSTLVIQKVIHPNAYSNCDNYLLPPAYNHIRTDYMPMVGYNKPPQVSAAPVLTQVPQHMDHFRLPMQQRLVSPDVVPMSGSIQMMQRMASLGVHPMANNQTFLRPAAPVGNYNARSVLLNSLRPQMPVGFMSPDLQLQNAGLYHQQPLSNIKLEPKT